jgi:hypothetical protein
MDHDRTFANLTTLWPTISLFHYFNDNKAFYLKMPVLYEYYLNQYYSLN